ncbi:hypothetical protein MMC13_004388 [Lambiella insularis]|nr:hypothetical protein [Lambiella insularis]
MSAHSPDPSDSSQASHSSHSSISSNNERSPLYKAAKSGSLSAVKAHMQQLRDRYRDLVSFESSLVDGLDAAIIYKHFFIVSYLLDHGAKLNPWLVGSAADEDTPLRVFEDFLNHGWDINKPIANGSPVLRYVMPNPTLVRWFLSHGADPNKRGYWGESPLRVACCSSTPEVVDLLLASGASLHHSSALHFAAEDAEHRPQSLTMLSHLLDLGVDVNELSDCDYPESRDYGFYTPLHAAVGADFAEAIRLLLKRGADREIRSSVGETPLEKALDIGHEAAVEALRQY